jgi:hypothetical protein
MPLTLCSYKSHSHCSVHKFVCFAEPKCLGMILISENYLHEEINSILNSGDAQYCSVKNILSSSFLSKNLKIKICQMIILPDVI